MWDTFQRKMLKSVLGQIPSPSTMFHFCALTNWLHSASNWIMTPKTPIANQLAESKSISQLRHWRALRKWLSQLYMSTGCRLVPTYLAFQDKQSPFDLICLPNNCNNYTALVKPVHPFLVFHERSEEVGEGQQHLL